MSEAAWQKDHHTSVTIYQHTIDWLDMQRPEQHQQTEQHDVMTLPSRAHSRYEHIFNDDEDIYNYQPTSYISMPTCHASKCASAAGKYQSIYKMYKIDVLSRSRSTMEGGRCKTANQLVMLIYAMHIHVPTPAEAPGGAFKLRPTSTDTTIFARAAAGPIITLFIRHAI